MRGDDRPQGWADWLFAFAAAVYNLVRILTAQAA
jgi:hypothetical protein